MSYRHNFLVVQLSYPISSVIRHFARQNYPKNLDPFLFSVQNCTKNPDPSLWIYQDFEDCFQREKPFYSRISKIDLDFLGHSRDGKTLYHC